LPGAVYALTGAKRLKEKKERKEGQQAIALLFLSPFSLSSFSAHPCVSWKEHGVELKSEKEGQ
jgi:hypothetical protein